MNRSIAVISFFACFIFTGCGANIFSTNQEVVMGRELAEEVNKQFDILENPEINEYISRIGQSIVEVCDRRDIEYHFFVVHDDETVNAFAMPGGFIYIYTGLLKRADSEAEVAGVLAHEVGHVVAKHSMKRMTQLYGYQVLSGLVFGEGSPVWQSTIADLFATAGILKYGRDNELESDRLGLNYIYRLGYDPQGMVSFFENLGKLSKHEPGAMEKMLTTHPDPQDRIQQLNAIIPNLPSRNDLRLYEDRYLAVKALLP